MNQQVLEAIIKLLVILAKLDGITKEERGIVEKFLHDHLNDQDVAKYLAFFDLSTEKTPADHSVVADISRQINQDLSLKQKMVSMATLMQIVMSDRALHSYEEDIMLIFCNENNIEDKYLYLIRDYLMAQVPKDTADPAVLWVDGKPDAGDQSLLHFQKQNLQTPIVILWVENVNMYFVRVVNDQDELLLNGELMMPTYSYPLNVGSVIRGEQISPLYYSDIVSCFHRKEKKEKLSFEAEGIDFFFKNGKQGLHNVNIAEESGHLVAIMGASGSGKSTLLNVLNGNLVPQNGAVTINGINVHHEKDKIEGVLGYVPQDDLLIDELTVYQNLFYAAKLCFGHYTVEELEALVKKTLENLGLYEVKDLKVGNALNKTISGGQRKRLNIGLELLREPSILFVDEPTSGLSSQDSENIIDLLRELALSGKLIFVVIHQPSSNIFKMFDRLIIMDTGGYQVFYGNPVESVVYFKTLANQVRSEQGACPECGNVNPEQVFEIIESKVLDEYGRPTKQRKTSPESWYKNFTDRIHLPDIKKVSEKPQVKLDIPSKFNQFRIFTLRDVLAKLSNTQYLAINLIQAPALAFILAYITRFYHIDELEGDGIYIFSENINIPSYIFMSIIVSLFMGLTVSAEEIIKDAKIVKREAFLKLSRRSYLLSKIAILFTLSAVQTALFVLVGNAILGIQDMFLQYWAVLFSISCLANMMGLNISSTFNSVITIYILIPILLIPQLILGGIVVGFDYINPNLINKEGKVPLIGEIMASRWAFEALVVSQFKDNPFEAQFYEADKKIAGADYHRTYYLPTLSSKAENLLTLVGQGKRESRQFTEDLQMLKASIRELLKELPKGTFPHLDKLNTTDFDAIVAEEAIAFIKESRGYYARLYNVYSKRKDEQIGSMIDTPDKRAGYQQNLKDFRNDRIEELVLNLHAEKRIVEYHDKLIQKVYPIYLDPPAPEHLFDFRSHFYAPTKFFAGQYVPTFAFNLGVIWTMALLLYATLYYRSFYAFFSWAGNRKLTAKLLEKGKKG